MRWAARAGPSTLASSRYHSSVVHARPSVRVCAGLGLGLALIAIRWQPLRHPSPHAFTAWPMVARRCNTPPLRRLTRTSRSGPQEACGSPAQRGQPKLRPAAGAVERRGQQLAGHTTANTRARPRLEDVLPSSGSSAAQCAHAPQVDAHRAAGCGLGRNDRKACVRLDVPNTCEGLLRRLLVCCGPIAGSGMGGAALGDASSGRRVCRRRRAAARSGRVCAREQAYSRGPSRHGGQLGIARQAHPSTVRSGSATRARTSCAARSLRPAPKEKHGVLGYLLVACRANVAVPSSALKSACTAAPGRDGALMSSCRRGGDEGQ